MESSVFASLASHPEDSCLAAALRRVAESAAGVALDEDVDVMVKLSLGRRIEGDVG